MNIIMLISESMRWDLLTPRIMPNMSRFADKAWNFTHHYSGGNGNPVKGSDLVARMQSTVFKVFNDVRYYSR